MSRTAKVTESSLSVETEKSEATCTSPDACHGGKTVCSFYLEGKCRFGETCYNVHPPDVVVPDVAQPKKSEAERKVDIVQETDEKKPPLKTASDVRKRIQWDPELQKEHFTVGYLDRFSGVVEKPFSAFTWEHPSVVDLDQLAVPQHRIHFYKYKGVTVWDKNQRLDHVFGSAGGNTTIREVIQDIEAKISEGAFGCDDDTDDDDDVVLLGTESSPGKGLISMISKGQSLKQELLRATHFFCIRVNNEGVKDKISSVQEQMVQEEPVLRSCIMPRDLLHVTLAMVKLPNTQAVQETMKLLRELQAGIKEIFMTESEAESATPARVIRARGLATFGARVLYAKLEVPDSFTTVIELLHEGLRHIDDAIITNHFDFVPHLTLLKVNRPTARERRSKYVSSSLYSDYMECDFGTVDFDNINLCVIDDMRGPDGFYMTCESIEF